MIVKISHLRDEVPMALRYTANVIVAFRKDGASMITKNRFLPPEIQYVPMSIQRRWFLQSLKIKDRVQDELAADSLPRLNKLGIWARVSQKEIDFYRF